MATVANQTRDHLLFDDLAEKQRALLMMGYDGVVAPFAADIDRALPSPLIRELIDAIVSTTHTEIVIVGDRSADEIRDLLHVYPNPEIWGCYGLEHIAQDGLLTRTCVPEAVGDGLAAIAETLEHEGLDGCLQLKHGIVAVRWLDLATHLASEVGAIAARVFSQSRNKDLIVRAIDGGLEIRYREALKSRAVSRVLSRARPGICMAYVGATLDDEEALSSLGGNCLGVFAHPERRLNSTHLQLQDAEDLTGFLFDWLCAAQGGKRDE
jgi:trehalose 6-phosphate phosphatase